VDHQDGKGDFLKMRERVIHQLQNSSSNILILPHSLVGMSGIEQHHSIAISCALVYWRTDSSGILEKRDSIMRMLLSCEMDRVLMRQTNDR